MRLLLGKLGAACFASSLLLVGASTLVSQDAPPSQASTSQATPPAAAAPADQSASAQPVDEWPNGPGKQQFLQICSSCHSPENVIGHNQDTSGWTDTLNQMIQNGAQGSDDDFSAVLQYLVTNFGPMPPKVNVNKATAMNLRSWLGMPEKEAEAIVAYRVKNGDYKSLDDLKKAPGVDPNYIDSEKDLLTFS
jgi:competence protein ComEA